VSGDGGGGSGGDGGDRGDGGRAGGGRRVTLVVPCYNEEARLDDAAMLSFVDAPAGAGLLFVDDGSGDGTAARLRALAAARPGSIDVLALPRNGGKAAAVREGLLHALAGGAELVGYFDADLSTPVPELLRLLAVAEARGASAVMGARVALLGSDIRRSAARHYLGRVFASLASLLLRARVYDTQCGAKIFRRSPALAAALASPFRSRWAFDVELLGRLLVGAPGVAPVPPAAFVEVPLAVWRDVPGSKLRPAAMAGALKDLAFIGGDLAARRRAARRGSLPSVPPAE
jgi:dolichyl-phosphate beta-glucosyltransferase